MRKHGTGTGVVAMVGGLPHHNPAPSTDRGNRRYAAKIERAKEEAGEDRAGMAAEQERNRLRRVWQTDRSPRAQMRAEAILEHRGVA